MTTKRLLLAGLAAATLTAGFAATRIQTSLVFPPGDPVSLEVLRKQPHPWTKSQPLPGTLADSGLRPDARVVHTALYLDGGSRFFVLQDSAGACLFFCTSKPYSQAKHGGDTGWQELFLLGATHYLDPAGVPVPRGSPTETLLLAAVKGRIVQVGTAALPAALNFAHTTAVAPTLTLKPGNSGPPGSVPGGEVPAEASASLPTFSAPASRPASAITPPLATERFPAALRAAAQHSNTVEIRTASPFAAPIAAGDLIGRPSDREKMLEEYRRRTATPASPPVPDARDATPAPRQP